MVLLVLLAFVLLADSGGASGAGSGAGKSILDLL